MTRIVAIGEAMVEMAPCEADGTYEMGFAGDTLNTAWYLRQLLPASYSIDFLSAVGTDKVSDQLVDFIEGAKIGTRHVARDPDLNVGLYMIQLTNGERSFSYWRGQSAARTLANDPAALTNGLTGADIAYFSGISFAILPEDGRTVLLDALRAFRGNGGQVVFDPNLRPRLWANRGEMLSAVMEAAAVSDVVLPSYEDEADWFGDIDPKATALRYTQNGAATVIVKNGSGSILSWESGEFCEHLPSQVGQVVDSTAAGDSFNAGFLASLLSGHSLESSVREAANLAALVIQARGALVIIPTK